MKKSLALVILLALCSAVGSASQAKAKEQSSAPADKTPASYMDKADQEIDKVTGKITTLKEKSENSGLQARQKLDHWIQVGREKWAALKLKLAEWKLALLKSWKSLTEGFHRITSDVQKHFETPPAASAPSAKTKK